MSWDKIENLVREWEFYSALPKVLKLLCVEVSASRCNFWRVENGFLVPLYNYEAEKDDYILEGLESLNLRYFPKYYKTLLKSSIIFAEDVNKDPSTSELSEKYWKPFGIQSTVDLMLRYNKKVVGVLCLEFKYRKSFSNEDRTRLKRIKNLLEKSYGKTLRLEEIGFKKLFEQVLNSPNVSIVLTNKSGIIRFVNETFEMVTGYNAFEVMNKKVSILKSGRHSKEFYKELWDTILAGKVWNGTFINRKKNGKIYYERKTIIPIIKKREILGFLSIGYEVTEEIKLQKIRFLFEEVVRIIGTCEDEYEILQKTCEAIYKTEDYELVWVAKRLNGSVGVVYAYGVVEYLKDLEINLEDQSSSPDNPTKRAFLTGRISEINNLDEIPQASWKDKAISFGFKSAISIPIKVGDSVEYVINLHSSEKEIFTDDVLRILEELATNLGVALEKMVMKGEMFKKEFYDGLTGLPNRKLFLENMEYNIDLARSFQKKLLLLVVDIFNFSLINANYGVNLGDRILLAFVEKLKSLCPEAHLIARTGSDEFAIAIFLDKDVKDILHRIEALREVDVKVDDLKVKLFTNIGVAVYPKDAEDGRSLFDKAIVALKKCKEQGRGCYCTYDVSLETEFRTRLSFEDEISLALERGEFLLYYQPIADIKSLKLSGVEALIRWFSPKRGFVSPATFIPIAESMNLMRDIDKFVLKSVRGFLHRLKNSGYSIPSISINLTPSNFDLLKEFFEDKYFIRCINIEITEREFFEVLKYEKVLSDFLELGGSLSIDDFGTGYSSLSYLSELPVRCVKIDISFVKKMLEDERAKKIVEAIIEISKTFGIESVAEGVEIEEQYNLLKKLGCSRFQGYFYFPPLKEEELVGKFLKPKA